MRTLTKIILLFVLLFFGWQSACATNFIWIDSIKPLPFASHNIRLSNEPPVLTAYGVQLYCPGTSIPIVSSMSITDPDDTATDAVYIQISLGYNSSQDILTLLGNHPNISATWNSGTGKLTLKNPTGAPVSYADFISAIEDVVYANNSATPSGTRTFSITVGQANFLPTTGHYYQYVPALGITWTAAKTAAEQSTYYGLQGYLATISATDEAQLAGEQASGAGWIGGSDEVTEGVWKWMSGPETGTVFWNGGVNGSTPNFAFWNNGEPNSSGDEDYAHITAPGVGIPGSWNDLPLAGSTGDYQPKGYIVEYGGMAGDPILNISTSTYLTISSITSTTAGNRCGAGSVTLNAVSSTGTVRWFDSASNGNLLFTGNNFVTPTLNSTTTYFADPTEPGCSTATRTAVTATINELPIISIIQPAASCEGSVTISATATAGTIHWYDSASNPTEIASGSTFVTPSLQQTTTFYAEAQNNGCNSSRVPVIVTIYQKPIVSDEQVILCANSSVTLDAGLPNHNYLWTPSGATTRQITVGQPGTYTVAVTSQAPQNCTSIKTIIVVEKAAPIIDEVVVNETTVTIVMQNQGEFEYSIDGVNYQQSNVFSVAIPGINKAYVRERHFCGNDDEDFIILIVPPFFSPNNDSFNDLWTVLGIAYYPKATIAIFDRYGKLIKQLTAADFYWDGKLDFRPLPASDYWYVLKIPGHPEKRGHFSLIR